jgi:hypothetical protein
LELTFRPARIEDFEAFYACCYSTFGYSGVFKAEVKVEWETFRQNPNALSVVVEDLEASREMRVVGYAEAVFIQDIFAKKARTGKRPFLNKQIAEMAWEGDSPLLDSTQIRTAQFGKGITLYVPYVGWHDRLLSPEDAWKVRDYTSSALNTLGLGYYYREVMIEVAGEVPKTRALDAGFYLRTDYTPFYSGTLEQPAQQTRPSPELRPYLLSITREEAFQRDGSMVSRSFVYSKPRFGLKPHEQEQLCWALQGRNDDEIARLVHVGIEAIKKRWDAIYARVEQNLPSLLPPRGEGRRGLEKRGLLLAYLRDHPEELRPCIVPLHGHGYPLQEKP